MTKFRLAALAAVLIAAAAGGANAQSATNTATATLSVAIQPPPLKLVFTPSAPTIPCGAPAGTQVAALSVTGGNGNPPKYAPTGGDTTDFAVSGANVVVGPNGAPVDLTNCGKTLNVTVTATQ